MAAPNPYLLLTFEGIRRIAAESAIHQYGAQQLEMLPSIWDANRNTKVKQKELQPYLEHFDRFTQDIRPTDDQQFFREDFHLLALMPILAQKSGLTVEQLIYGNEDLWKQVAEEILPSLNEEAKTQVEFIPLAMAGARLLGATLARGAAIVPPVLKAASSMGRAALAAPTGQVTRSSTGKFRLSALSGRLAQMKRDHKADTERATSMRSDAASGSMGEAKEDDEEDEKKDSKSKKNSFAKFLKSKKSKEKDEEDDEDEKEPDDDEDDEDEKEEKSEKKSKSEKSDKKEKSEAAWDFNKLQALVEGRLPWKQTAGEMTPAERRAEVEHSKEAAEVQARLKAGSPRVQAAQAERARQTRAKLAALAKAKAK